MVMTAELGEVNSEQLAAAKALAHASVTRTAVSERKHSVVVVACLHSPTRRWQSFSRSMGRRPGALLEDAVGPAPELELLEDVSVPVPGNGSHAMSHVAAVSAAAVTPLPDSDLMGARILVSGLLETGAEFQIPRRHAG